MERAQSVPQFRLEQFIHAGIFGAVKLPCIAFVFICGTLGGNAAVTLNQIETFSGVHEWTSGNPNPNPPVILADSGPLGPGDNALKVTSNGGSGAGSRLVVFNQTLWTGDYMASGILGVAADLRNSGATTLSFRVAFDGPGGKFVTAPSTVTAFSGWAHRIFDIQPAALISAGGSNAAATLAAVTEIRILHSATVDFRGAAVSSAFLMDNIQAVPEPGLGGWVFLCGAGLFFRKR